MTPLFSTHLTPAPTQTARSDIAPASRCTGSSGGGRGQAGRALRERERERVVHGLLQLGQLLHAHHVAVRALVALADQRRQLRAQQLARALHARCARRPPRSGAPRECGAGVQGGAECAKHQHSRPSNPDRACSRAAGRVNTTLERPVCACTERRRVRVGWGGTFGDAIVSAAHGQHRRQKGAGGGVGHIGRRHGAHVLRHLVPGAARAHISFLYRACWPAHDPCRTDGRQTTRRARQGGHGAQHIACLPLLTPHLSHRAGCFGEVHAVTPAGASCAVEAAGAVRKMIVQKNCAAVCGADYMTAIRRSHSHTTTCRPLHRFASREVACGCGVATLPQQGAAPAHHSPRCQAACAASAAMSRRTCGSTRRHSPRHSRPSCSHSASAARHLPGSPAAAHGRHTAACARRQVSCLSLGRSFRRCAGCPDTCTWL